LFFSVLLITIIIRYFILRELIQPGEKMFRVCNIKERDMDEFCRLRRGRSSHNFMDGYEPRWFQLGQSVRLLLGKIAPRWNEKIYLDCHTSSTKKPMMLLMVKHSMRVLSSNGFVWMNMSEDDFNLVNRFIFHWARKAHCSMVEQRNRT
jgi:hypothetical protein